MELTMTQRGLVTIIALDGNLMGGPDATLLNTRLHELVDSGKKQIIIDLAHVHFMNSSGLGLLIGGVSALKNAGGALRLANASEKIQSLITITKLGSVLPTFSSIDAAMESFKK